MCSVQIVARYQLYCVIVFYILLQQEMKCLADARRFYPFHSDTLFQKIVASLRNWIYAEMPLVTKIVYLIFRFVSKDIFHKKQRIFFGKNCLCNCGPIFDTIWLYSIAQWKDDGTCIGKATISAIADMVSAGSEIFEK